MALGTPTLPRPERNSKNQGFTQGEVLAGLHSPAQRNPWNALWLKSNSCVGEHGWVLEGWCKTPGTGQRDSSASRAAGVLCGDWSPAPLCCWEPTAMERNESCLPAEQTACASALTVSVQRGRHGTEHDRGSPLISSLLTTTIYTQACIFAAPKAP